jgi:hypothetical protein
MLFIGVWFEESVPRTNDLLYESNDSRDIGKCSISARFEGVFADELELLERCGQKLLFSGGEGYVGLAQSFLI